MPRPVKKIAALALIRIFRFFLSTGRVVRSALLFTGRSTIATAILIGGPIYRWSHAARLFVRANHRLLEKRPHVATALVLGIVFTLGLSDTWAHRNVELDPFGSRPIFSLLERLRPSRTPDVLDMPSSDIDLGDQPQTAMTNEQTTVLKPQILTTTSGRKTPTTYAVAPGDSLSSIADRFGLKITTLLWTNKLTPTNTLQIGQELTVLPVDGMIHVVKSGDTVESIAKRYNADAEKILSFNGLKPRATLRLAMNLIVPDGRPTYEPPPTQPKTRLARIQKFISRTIEQPIRRLGAFLWPTAFRHLNQYFSWYHPGVDIKGTLGSPVYAAADGTITQAGWNRGGYGNQVIIDHPDGRSTRYAHLSKIDVEIGDNIKQGQVIGLVGSTGRSTGPHLHFEVIAGGRRLNPLGFLR